MNQRGQLTDYPIENNNQIKRVCPFCESDKVVVFCNPLWYIGCNDCGARGPTKIQRLNAIAAWDER